MANWLKSKDDQLGNWLDEKGIRKKPLKQQITDLVANRPQYAINDEAYDNQALAKARAFGRDRTVQMAEENVDQDVATDVGQAKNISGNTGSVLDTLRAIATGGMDSKRNLAMQESSLRDSRMGELYNANNAMIDEKDKAWNFNVNEPYQNKIMELRQKRRFRQELGLKALDFAGTIAAAGMTGGTSLAVKGVGGAPVAPINGYDTYPGDIG